MSLIRWAQQPAVVVLVLLVVVAVEVVAVVDVVVVGCFLGLHSRAALAKAKRRSTYKNR